MYVPTPTWCQILTLGKRSAVGHFWVDYWPSSTPGSRRWLFSLFILNGEKYRVSIIDLPGQTFRPGPDHSFSKTRTGIGAGIWTFFYLKYSKFVLKEQNAINMYLTQINFEDIDRF